MALPGRDTGSDAGSAVLRPLTFQAPDTEAFPCLALARQCARTGGTACAIMNGANEEAVGLFLRQEIGFNDIARRVEDALCGWR